MAPKALSLVDIDAYYGDGHVLQKVSFAVGEGRLLGLIGRNGAGKSTCMSVAVLALVQSDLHQVCSKPCREGRTNYHACLEDAAATAQPKTKAAASTSRNLKPLRTPPMGLGTKASEIGKKPKRSVAAGLRNRNAGAEHWTDTLWKNAAN